MQPLNDFTGKYDFKVTKNVCWDLAQAIIEVTGDHPRYNIYFWLKKTSMSKLSAGEIYQLCDKAKTLDKRYNKGGFILKRLFPKK